MCGHTGVGFMHSTFEMLSSMKPFLGMILQVVRSLFILCRKINLVLNIYCSETVVVILRFLFASYFTAGGGKIIADVFSDKSTCEASL